MYNRTLLISSVLLCLSLCQVAWADERKENLTQDVKLLQDAGIATDGPGLLQFFRKKTLSEDQRDETAGRDRRAGPSRPAQGCRIQC